MALTATERVAVYTDTLRGLEADRLRAEILAAGDEYQAERAGVLDKQIAAAQEKLDEAREQMLAEDASHLHEFVSVHEPEAGWADGYSRLTKADFKTEFARRGIAYDDSDTIAVLTDKLRAYDLHHTGVAVAAGVTPGV